MTTRATWTAKYVNDLPDAAFACIDDGGAKDDDGKTAPRDLRHYPHHTTEQVADGHSMTDCDPTHVNAAWQRLQQEDTTSCGHGHIAAHRKAMGMDEEKATRPRDDLTRMVEMPAADLRFVRDEGDDGVLGMLTGYAAVFNSDTIIDSWEGRFVERIAPGAFKKTLAERGDRVKVLFNHGFDPSIGDKPLGKPSVMAEQRKGLWTETPLDDTSYNRDLVASLRSGALDGMSFRFSVADDEWQEPDDSHALPIRTVRAVKLYEFGPVTFPAYEATTAGVRARQAFEAWRIAHPVGTAEGIPALSVVAASGTAPAVVVLSETERTKARSRALWLENL